MHKVSIIVPAFKEAYLSETLDSLLNQTFDDFELIIVNDNPRSSIREIVSNYNDNRISYYENEKNVGLTDLVKNWNNCLSKAHGEFILFPVFVTFSGQFCNMLIYADLFL